MNNSIVYIVTPPGAGRSVVPAQEYGRLEFVFSGSTYQPSLDPEQALGIAEDALKGFDWRVDYLVFAGGDPVGLMICTMAVMGIIGDGCDHVKTLRWERGFNGQRGSYVPCTIPSMRVPSASLFGGVLL